MAEQIDRRARRGSRASEKRITCKERRQIERHATHGYLDEVRRMRDRHLGYELDWADLVSPPPRLAFHGWDD